MGLEDYHRIALDDTEIVPFAVPHVPQRLLYGRVRKQIEHNYRQPQGSQETSHLTKIN